MSLPAAAKAAAHHIAKDVTTKTKPASKAPNFLTFKFQANPKPLNCTTFPMTKDFALDPSHPLHIRTTRRLAAFDSSVLHWNVKTPLEMSKKATVRAWAIRRVKVAFREALKEGGWQTDGSGVAYDGDMRLRGALCIFVQKDKDIIEASGEDVRRQCVWLLRKIVQLQTDRAQNGRSNGGQRVPYRYELR
jgi:hypothetical protein